MVLLLGLPFYVFSYIMAGSGSLNVLLVGLMFVPTIAALIASFITKVKISFGKPSFKYIAVGIAFPFSVWVVYWLASVIGLIAHTGSASFGILFAIFGAALLAVGEEIGWRGYLLPNLRKNNNFFKANLILAIVWLVYHVPVILTGAYNNDLLPLYQQLIFFTLNIFAFSFIVGIIWEYSRDVEMSTFAHGSWNTLLEGALPAMFITTSPWLLGEFGFLPFVALSITLIIAIIIYRIRPPKTT